MRCPLAVLALLLASIGAVRADVGIRTGVDLGVDLPAHPRLIRVPGHPVHYDPRIRLNYFFFDGMFWMFENERWYASTWYNGPWNRVGIYDVPVYVLRVPVRYYHRPPPYFHGWNIDAPPRWSERRGPERDARGEDWAQRDRRATPNRTPHAGIRHPQAAERQHGVRTYPLREDFTGRQHAPQRSGNGVQGGRRHAPPEHGRADRR